MHCTALHCNALQCTTMHCNRWLAPYSRTTPMHIYEVPLQHTATHCNATYCNALQKIAAYTATGSSHPIHELPPRTSHCNTLQRTATCCNTHCNTRWNRWLAPYSRTTPAHIYFIFQEPVTLSMVKIWNYSRTPARGAFFVIHTTLQNTLTYCNTMKHTAAYCNYARTCARGALFVVHTHCNTPYHTATH